MKKIIGVCTFVLSMISISCMPVFAATSQDYEKLGESFSPILIVGIIVLVYFIFRKKKTNSSNDSSPVNTQRNIKQTQQQEQTTHVDSEPKTTIVEYCPSCGFEIKQGQIYCENCGNKLD